MDASMQFEGIFVVSINLRNSVESFRYEGKFFTCGCNHLSTNWDMDSVILLQLDTIGLIPMGFLWIFFKKIKSGCACLSWWFAKFKPCLF